MPKNTPSPLSAAALIPSLAMALLLASLPAAPLLAQGHAGHGGGHGRGDAARPPAAAAPAGPAAVLVARGVVKEIDAAGTAVVLDHEAIPALRWEGMTMRFPVEDPTLLEGLREGDEIRFDLRITGTGPDAAYAIADLEVE
ncbi:MAG: copper-binding protein [Deltaproteobacteria bacterium]|jgi:Cu/Ag efflux protein CusF|nr:copper-binding protein [Deltaproteobacteria bacterium]